MLKSLKVQIAKEWTKQLANVQQQEKRNKSKRTFQLTTFVSSDRRNRAQLLSLRWGLTLTKFKK